MDRAWRDSLQHISPQVLAQTEALEALLAPAVFEQILRLVDEAFQAGSDDMSRERDLLFEAILEHVPGIAPALRLVEGHILTVTGPCHPERPDHDCAEAFAARFHRD